MKNRHCVKITLILLSVFFSAVIPAGCRRNPDTEKAKATIFAMDTYMTLLAYGTQADAAVADASAEITRLEQLLSTNIETSEVAMINRNGGGKISPDTYTLIDHSLDFYKNTDGAYDITIYPIVRAWGFTTGEYTVLNAAEEQKLLPLVGSDKIDLSADEVSFEKPGMMIDLGTIAKGYTSQRIADLWCSRDIKSGLINLGGNVQVLGDKPDGSPWRVAIQKPDKDAPDTDYIGILSCHDCAVTTAGGYERYFEENGVIYRHIFDPATGFPVSNDLKSVSVIAKDGITADGYDTALYVMGKEKAISYWRNHADLFSIILVDEEDTVYVSDSIASYFVTDYDKVILSKTD